MQPYITEVMFRVAILVLFFVVSFLLIVPALAQAEECGAITAPANWWVNHFPIGSIETKTIENCSDPFGVTTDEYSNPYTLFIGGNEIPRASSTFLVETDTFTDVTYSGGIGMTSTNLYGFRHTDTGYDFVPLQHSDPTKSDIVAYAQSYFTDEVVRSLYTEIVEIDNPNSYFYDDNGELRLDSEGQVVRDRYYKFKEDFDSQWWDWSPVLDNGTYTFVWVAHWMILTEGQPSFWNKIRSYILPTAYASMPYIPPLIFTQTVTISKASETPVGASSVLFLPGIMGSRLYEDADTCNTTGEGQERWVSLSVCDQLRLAMSTSGISVNDIYTKSNQSSILVSQVYKTFFANLADWKEEKLIKDYVAVPYDWRLGLDKLLKVKEDPTTGKIKFDSSSSIQEGYLYKTLKKLADESYNGKVTIVAHSNGGLLAKALLATLDRDKDPLVGKVDVLIMVASPQLGTPDTLVGMLHGSEILPYLLIGNVVSQKTSRQLLGTMPFAYHLLPATQYFSGDGVAVNTPVLTFDAGSLTTPWANTYGSTVTTAQGMQAFMQTSSGRAIPSVDDLSTPAVVSSIQFSYANSIHLLMNAWVPASTTKVYEIAGTGIKTAAGIRYYTGRECGVTNPFCLIFNPKIMYQVNHTVDGDGTVVVPSALGMSTSSTNVTRKWINLSAFNLTTDSANNHSSIFNVPEISSFIKAILELATSTNYQYITNNAPQITDDDRLDFYLHSPLDMSLKLSNGKEISSSSPETMEGVYRRYGELQYISVPNNKTNKTLVLKGNASGSFTLEIEESKNGSTTIRQSYSAIPSSTSTSVTAILTDSTSLPGVVLAVDYDGNGSIDVNYDTTGQVVTYTTLFNTINSLAIASIYKKILLETAKIAEQNYQKSLLRIQFKKLEKVTLNALRQQIILYGKLRIISNVDQQKLILIIDNLLNK